MPRGASVAEQAITKHRLLVTGATGVLVKNPATTLARQYRTALQAWVGRFGPTPADRLRLEVAPKEEPKDEIEQFLRGPQPDDSSNPDPRRLLATTEPWHGCSAWRPATVYRLFVSTLWRPKG